MTKILILVGAVIVIVWLLKRALGSRSRDGGAGQAPEAAPAKPGQLVACAHCGVNLPQAEARSESSPSPAAGGTSPVVRYYCSEEHLRAGPRRR